MVEYLTDLERAALEDQVLRERAKTVKKFVDFALTLGVPNDNLMSAADMIRQADPETQKKLRKNLGALAEFFAASDIDNQSNEPTEIDTSSSERVPLIDTLATPPAVNQPLIYIEKETKRSRVTTDAAWLIRRLTLAKELTLDDLATTDPDELMKLIASSTKSGKLSDYTAEKLRAAASGIPKDQIEGIDSALANIYMSIRDSGKTPQLLDAVTRKAETVETIQPSEDIDAILLDSIENPRIVTTREWQTAAYQRFIEASVKAGLNELPRNELWSWVHFEDGEAPAELSLDGKTAIKDLQQRFLAVDKQYFKEHPAQNVAARTLVITANGYKRLNEVCDMIRRLPKYQDISDAIAERHVVAAVTHLLNQEQA